MSLLKKIIKTFLIIIRGFSWLFFMHGRQKILKVWWAYKFGGLKLCRELAVAKFGNSYNIYDHKRNQLTRKQSDFLINRFEKQPKISIITPVYKIDTKWLSRCIDSVRSQYYQNWELVLVDDASGQKDITKLLNKYASRDNRIRFFALEQNSGIVGATNSGIKEAIGDYIGFLDHDDELTPDALTWMVWAINKNPQALWFYSDEDKISDKNKYHSQCFKPDFSREFLLSNMFTCHFSVYSSQIIRQVNGLRAGFDGSQDHDLALRISEIVPQNKVVHIPRVLYHWRIIPGSSAMGIEEKPKAPEAGRKAVQDALERRGLKGIVTSNKTCPTIYEIELEPNSFPDVTIIIPTYNSLTLVRNCINSISRNTEYPNYDILVIDNKSDDKEFLEYIKDKESQGDIKVMRYDKPFNHSDMNNVAVQSVSSEFVVFMNNDIEIINDKWLEQLVATINIDENIANVGCLLLFDNMTIQHGGVILGLNSVASHAHKGLPLDSLGYYGRMITLQEMSCVTAALSIIRRSAFESVGGFNSERYPTSFNDVDMAIRLRKNGYRIIYNPMVRAFHYESKTRPIGKNEIVYRQNMRDDYAEILDNDPFYNPNLSLGNEQFKGFKPFPVEEQIVELKDL